MKTEGNTPYFIFNYCSVSGSGSCAFCIRDGVVEYSYVDSGAMQSFTAAASDALWESIVSLLEKHSVASWKGGRLFRHFAFAVSPDTYTLDCLLPNGDRYEANASAGFPKEFNEALEDFKDLFISLN